MKIISGLRNSILTLITAISISACNLTSTKPTTPATPAKPQAVIGLALGGGVSKGFAHIGVIKVLQENHIPVRIVTGTSAGALVGSLYASGMSPDRLELEAEILNKADLVDPVLSTSGFLKGQKLQDYINNKVRNKPMQQFPIRFGAVATEFGTGRMAVFTNGNAGLAVRASASIPNIFQPAVIGNKRFVDGGLVAPVPVTAAKQLGANVVIAVDISAKPATLTSTGFFSYLDQSLNIMSSSALNSELSKAQVVIRPQVQKLGTIGGFDQKAQAIKLGEDAARAALPQIRAVLSKYQVN